MNCLRTTARQTASSTAAVGQRPGVRCATLRIAFGLSIFAATGAGAGTAGFAHAATPQQPAAVTAQR